MITIKIWQIRNEKGISLRKLADMTGISKTSINDFENGKISPTLDELDWIAEALEVEITDLFDRS